MEIRKASEKKELLKNNIIKLLQDFSEETGLKLGDKIEISSFYDVERVKGKYHINLKIRNPF